MSDLENSSPKQFGGSVLRVLTPTKAVRRGSQTAEARMQSQITGQEPQISRLPLREVSNGASMTASLSASTAMTSTDSRKLSFSALGPSLRKVSAERGDPAARLNGDTFSPSLSPAHENGTSSWSSAVGHATTSGKSGRVIERLMAENDRLKRDLELQLLRLQDLERNLQTMRPQMDALRAENSNLTHAQSVDVSLLARRDRKIESLKEDLVVERERREASEALARHTMEERDDAIESARRDVQRAQEEAKHSTVHAGILEQSHRQLATEYRTRAERWRKDIDSIHTDRRADGQKLARLEVVADQMRTELERSRKVQAEYVGQFDTYKQSTDMWISDIDGAATAETQRSQKLNDDMETVVNKMRWVMSNQTRLIDEKTHASTYGVDTKPSGT